LIKSFPGCRSLLAAAVVTLGLIAPSTAMGASALMTFDFPGGTFEPSFRTNFGATPLTGIGTPAPTGTHFAAGGGYGLNTSGVFGNNWSLATYFNFDVADPNAATGDLTRVIDFSSGTSDAGVYLHDGVPAWVDSGGSVVQEGGTAFVDNADQQLVLTYDGLSLRVYQGNASTPVFTVGSSPISSVSSGIRLFKDNTTGPQNSAGDIRRLRIFTGPLTGPEVAGLHTLDTTAPSAPVVQYAGTMYNDERWFGRYISIGGTSTDDGSGPLTSTFDVVGTGVSSTPGFEGYAQSSAPEAITTYFGPFADGRDLANDGSYTARLKLADKPGNETTLDLPFRVDLLAPNGLKVDTGDTTETNPTISGSANVGPRARAPRATTTVRTTSASSRARSPTASGAGRS
jgi:hypothetical protein